ncbi:uncharacterized protein SLC30A4-AS1 [Callithrix jacchus]|uniref:normal mucosa of esophagus-specific gene 1 protein isoform X1 n=1 Tax=Callithrix jacchus TaxID=9483 RepID=UPI00159E2FC3|nr:normal mucosa of esophagus-specific gene 1 protein isoform X1 [Callithrix jacchus]
MLEIPALWEAEVSASAYCKLAAFLLQNTRPLARKPWNFPSKESSATPGHRKVTNGQTRSECEEEAPALSMLSGAPPKGAGNCHKQDPEHPGSVWAADSWWRRRWRKSPGRPYTLRRIFQGLKNILDFGKYIKQKEDGTDLDSANTETQVKL